MMSLHQKILMETFRASALVGNPAPNWHSAGFCCHSQFEEDGYRLYIFAVIGFSIRKTVEICCGSGEESNTANLIINHCCTGLLLEADEDLANHAVEFFRKNTSTSIWPPRIVNTWVTKVKIHSLILENGFEGSIDLLSIDIDGIDFSIWEAIQVVSPRVVIAEINHLWGPDVSVTVPYDTKFKAEFTSYGSDYAGASVSAFCKLGKQKGYRLVGANAICTNVFWLEMILCTHGYRKFRPALFSSIPARNLAEGFGSKM